MVINVYTISGAIVIKFAMFGTRGRALMKRWLSFWVRLPCHFRAPRKWRSYLSENVHRSFEAAGICCLKANLDSVERVTCVMN